ncbi:MAG TPA: excinuclease ABC subunit UvrB [Gemmata sp.]|jgi:excinuclease ABC subunit B|nr:excinuclease ABC subunit UvrB [Gemmata sp.]
MAAKFQLESPYEPAGDQPKAIKQLSEGFVAGKKFQVLLGATGTGKTYTASHIIAKLQKPTLVLAHNKTLAAQLFKEFRNFFPHNSVCYFVSYYDYYQPEAYIPQRDIYIEKDASINENIDRLRLFATSALVSREDVIIVASVSCIYGLGSPSDYKRMMIYLPKGEVIDRQNLFLRLVDIQYQRNDVAFERGKFRARGDTIDVWPASEEVAYRIELFGDEVDALSVIHPLTGETLRVLEDLYIFPAKHFVTPEERVKEAIIGIEQELNERLEQFKTEGKLLEAERLKARTRYDLDMLREAGYCSGIENYARWFSGRKPGEPPYTLIDFFPEDFLLIVDESHVSLPQVRGMYFGDRSRKETLVEHGFRLPSALDNRPLKFDEFEKRMNTCLCLSATPGPYELEKVGGEVVEQVIRPTGLVDPVIYIKPARGQVQDLINEIGKRSAKKERTLVTVLTKRMAEDLTTYFRDAGLRCKWLHSELDAIERIQVLRELREGQFDVLVGVNLLREGLDLPEVSLVVIMDADKEGFLRSEKSLIQTMGRAARNVNAEVILYADTVTDSMSRAVSETNRRREIQLAYNKEHGITPKTVQTSIKNSIETEIEAHKMAQEAASGASIAAEEYITVEYIQELYEEMLEAAKLLDFERAQLLRDQIVKLEVELKKKHGDAAPPSVLGNKSVPVSLPQPKGRKRWQKGKEKPKNA